MNIFKYHLSMIDSFYPQLILNFSHFSFYLILIDSKSNIITFQCFQYLNKYLIIQLHSTQITYNFLN